MNISQGRRFRAPAINQIKSRVSEEMLIDFYHDTFATSIFARPGRRAPVPLKPKDSKSLAVSADIHGHNMILSDHYTGLMCAKFYLDI